MKAELREYLRKEQEYEDRFDFLIKENQKLTNGNDKNDLDSLQSKLRSKESEIESLSIQLATYKTENDSLLTERYQFKKDMENIEKIKEENEKKQLHIQSLESTFV